MEFDVSSETLVGKTLGNYLVTEKIGSGGMGSVYLGEHPDIGRKVAIKVLAPHLSHQPGVSERFLTEAKAVARIAHPNIIDIYDFSRKKGNFFYVMEYLQGQELGELIKKRVRMSAPEVVPYLEQICGGIKAAHDAGIIHRDLKPENILVLEGEPLRLKLIDFGLVKMLGPEASASNLTATGMVMGSPLTMAPEQVTSEPDKIGPETDIYSLGIIIYWMLAGRPPFINHPRPMLMTMHVTDPPPPLLKLAPWVPAEIAALVESCLAKEPSERPKSAKEVSERFRQDADKEGKMSVEKMRQLLAKRASAKKAASKATAKATAKDEKQPVTVAVPSGALPKQPEVVDRMLKAAAHTQLRPSETPASGANPLDNDGSDSDFGPRDITTLGGAVGQIQQAPPATRRPAIGRWLSSAAAVAAVCISLFLGLRDNGSPAGERSSMSGRVSGAAVAVDNTPSQTKHVIAVTVADDAADNAAGSQAQCIARIDGQAQPVQPPPCRLIVPEGSKLDLRVERDGLKPFNRKWKVVRALALNLSSDAAGRALVQVSKTPPPAAVRPAEAKKPPVADEQDENVKSEPEIKKEASVEKRSSVKRRKRRPIRRAAKVKKKETPKAPNSLEGTVGF